MSASRLTCFKHVQLWHDIASHIYYNVSYKAKRCLHDSSKTEFVFSGADCISQALQFCHSNPDHFSKEITRDNVRKLCQLFLISGIFEPYYSSLKKTKITTFHDSSNIFYKFVEVDSPLNDLPISGKTLGSLSTKTLDVDDVIESKNVEMNILGGGPIGGEPIVAGDRNTLKITTPVAKRLGIEKESVALAPSGRGDFVPGSMNCSTPTKNYSTLISNGINNHDTLRKQSSNKMSKGGANDASNQQNAIYGMISKFLGLSVKTGIVNNGIGDPDLMTTNGSSNSGSSDSVEQENGDDAILDVDATQQAMLDRLLQMVELSFLDEVIEYLSCEKKHECYVHLFSSSNISLSLNSLSLSDESLNSKNDDDSLNSIQSGLRSGFNRAVAPCLQFHPQISALVPQNKFLTADQKRSLVGLVMSNYKEFAAIPSKMRDLFFAVNTVAMSNEHCKILDCLFLFINLLQSEHRLRLKNIVTFLKHLTDCESQLFAPLDNRSFVMEKFSTCLLEDKRDCSAVLSLLIEYQNRVFVSWATYCDSYHEVVLPGSHRRLERSTFCRRISAQQFVQQKRVNTTDELVSLMEFVLNEKSLSIRQKNKLLRALQSKHPDVYGLYFFNSGF